MKWGKGYSKSHCWSQGYTIEEAIANLKEATELYLEEFPLEEISKPLMTTFEAVVNA
jgi:predicted RNase H-like HicB family nuclease